MVNHIRFFWTNFGVVECLVNFVWFGFHPFTVFPVFSTLRNLTNIDFGIKISSKSLVMITGITVYNIQVMNFVEMMFGGISSINACHSGVETTTKDRSESCFLEFFFIRPLPAIFEVCLILWLVIGSVHIVYSGLKAGIHNGKILIRQCHIDY